MNFNKILFLLGAITLSINSSEACTRILKADHEPAVMVGRNMDWNMPEQILANLWVYPRGVERQGLTAENPLHWVAKYGSIVATVYDETLPITTDGMNEKGLSAHVNALLSSDYGVRNPNIPGLSVVMWTQYYLDNFNSVDEAVRFTSTNAFQLVTFYDKKTGRTVPLHLALEDASGDSAVIEYIDGQAHIYHDRAYTAMTNDPVYSEQLTNLKNYKVFGGNEPLPGTSSPKDRFVRATYYAQTLPEYKTVKEEVAGMFSVVRNAAQPAGERVPTVWQTVSDLTNKTYYFSSMRTLNFIYASLASFNLQQGAKVKRLIVQDKDNLQGDVSGLFKVVE